MEQKSKLKTLKDFAILDLEYKDRENHNEILRDIKQEAIKLFKTKKVMMMTAQEFIHWWFNITEDDLEDRAVKAAKLQKKLVEELWDDLK